MDPPVWEMYLVIGYLYLSRFTSRLPGDSLVCSFLGNYQEDKSWSRMFPDTLRLILYQASRLAGIIEKCDIAAC